MHKEPEGLTVVSIVGVNGTGKTTTAAKLAHLVQARRQTALLAACDTFRAAAVEQLQIWGERVKRRSSPARTARTRLRGPRRHRGGAGAQGGLFVY